MRTRFVCFLIGLCFLLTGAVAVRPATFKAAENGDEIVVEIFDLFYWVEWFGIPADTDVEVRFVNRGGIEHTFNVDELGIDLRIAPGAEERIVFNAPAGSYEFYCNSPGHREAGMFGMLRVGAPGPGEQLPASQESIPEGAGEAPRPVSNEEVIEISVDDNGFDGQPWTLIASRPYVIKVTNDGTETHNFSIDPLGIDVDISAGATEEVLFFAPLGDFFIYCKEPGHFKSEHPGVISTVEGSAVASPVVPDLRLAPGCEGMVEYQAAMDAAMEKGPFQDSALSELSDRYDEAINQYSQFGDASGLSPNEWLTLSAAFESSRQALIAITPPEFALAWHENQIAGANVWVQFFRAFGEGNPPSLEEFENDFERLLAENETARLNAVDACPYFAEWAPPVYRD